MLSNGSGARIQMFQHQADLYVNQNAPGSGDVYYWSTDGSTGNAVGALSNVRIIQIVANCTWTVQPTPLEVHVTIDGHTETFEKANPVSTTFYIADFRNDVTNQLATIGGNTPNNKAFLMEGRNVRVSAEITGGTVSNLKMYVKFARCV